MDTSKYNESLAKVSDNDITDYLDSTATDPEMVPASEESNATNSEKLVQNTC